ncbi:MAG: hypothetical protein Fur0032_10340 [Terrimicrobiaceae bacterium]
MKSSFSPVVLVFTTLTLVSTPTLFSQDILTLTNGQRREAAVLGVSGDRVRFKTGPVESSLPLSQIQSVTMAAPKAFENALASWTEGDAAKTLTQLKPLVENFRGLPTPWARRASALLGEVLIANNQIPAAEEAFAAFQKSYPNAQGLSDIGLARLALEQKDFDTAKAKVTPLVEKAKKTLIAGSGESAQFGQALYILASVQENEGRLADALENYLLVVTVFHEDAAITRRAQDRADALSGSMNVAVP